MKRGTDSIGREYCTDDGTRISCGNEPTAESKPTPAPSAPTEQSSSPVSHQTQATDGASEEAKNILPKQGSTRNITTLGEVPAEMIEIAEEADLSEDEVEALTEYIQEAYGPINEGLRTGTLKQDPMARTIAKEIQRVMKRLPALSQPALVYRGLNIGDPKTTKALIEQFETAAKSGNTIKLNGFQSASTELKTAWEFSSQSKGDPVVFEIAARKGLFIGATEAAEESDESEFLMPHGNNYRVVRVEKANVSTDSGDRQTTIIQLEQIVE